MAKKLPKAHPFKVDLTMVLTKKFGLLVDSGKTIKLYAPTNLNGLKLVPRVHVTLVDRNGQREVFVARSDGKRLRGLWERHWNGLVWISKVLSVSALRKEMRES